jgi:diguanylate cyclase (GGDEF)-like protein
MARGAGTAEVRARQRVLTGVALVLSLLWQQAVMAQTLRVGVYANEPKLMLAEDGQPSGLLGDLLVRIAEEEGWTLIPVSCPWEQCLELLDSRAIDLLPDVAYTSERAQRFDFHSYPALHSWSQLFSAPGNTLSSPLQLDGRRIALLRDGVQQDYLSQLGVGFGVDIELLPVDSFAAAFRAVEQGRADLAVSNHLFGNVHAAEYGLAPTAIVFQPSRLFYAAPRNQGAEILSRIDAWLLRWTSDATSPYYAIMQRWGAYTPRERPSDLIVWGALLLALLLMAAIGVALWLSRQVRRRGAALAESRYRLLETLNFDRVTGLANRHQLQERLDSSLAAAQRDGGDGALLHIDLDNFRDLNDNYGHRSGDQLLRQVAERLNRLPIPHLTPARFEGDAFMLLMDCLPGDRQSARQQVEQTACDVRAALQAPFPVGALSYAGSACIGVAMFSDVDFDAHRLLQSAELAMYNAKSSGRDTVRYFNPAMQAEARERAELEQDLLRGLQAGEFCLWYQPQYNTAGEVVAVEALARWEHPLHGTLLPQAFIGPAELSGQILSIGRYLLREACEQLAEWARHPVFGELNIAVNISARQLQEPDFVTELLAILEASGARGERLELELTESVLLDGVEDAIVKMLELASHGIRFSIDDFGTGYSSMSYLKRLPLAKLKIDKDFVRDILTDPNDAAIVRAIITLGQSLGLTVIAEGVETDAQRDILVTSGCPLFQGYLFSRPQPASELESYLDIRSA